MTVNYSLAVSANSISVGLTSTGCADGAVLLNSEVCLDCTNTMTIFTDAKSLTTTNAIANCNTCSLTNASISCSACASPYALIGGTCV